MKHPVYLSQILILLLTLALSGCKLFGNHKKVTTTDKTLSIMISTSAYLNPNILSESSPVSISVMLLQANTNIEQATYTSISANDFTGLVSSRSWVVWPSSTLKKQLIIPSEVKKVAVIAGFRILAGKFWKKVLTLNPNSHNLTINVSNNGIKLKEK